MPARSSYDYAVLRVVPRVERGEFINVGVLVYCAEHGFLAVRVELDEHRLAGLAPGVDPVPIRRYLEMLVRVSRGVGPVGRLPPVKRFDWLVSPRSTVVQTSPVHCGLCEDPAETLEHLMDALVRQPNIDSSP